MKTIAVAMLAMLLALARAGTAQETNAFSFAGTVVHKTLEGGFFAIEADDGRKFMPLGLPPEFAVDGLRVQVTARSRGDALGIQMYGTIIEIAEISRLLEPPCP